jgi:hypothetical protein
MPTVTIIPTGTTGVKTGNDWFRIISEGAKISRDALAAEQKHLPSKRIDLCKTK